MSATATKINATYGPDYTTDRGPAIKIVKRTDVPSPVRAGREAFILGLPFWSALMEKLNAGLGSFEAVDIDIIPTVDPWNNVLDAGQMTARIRYQFHKLGLTEKFSLIVGQNGENGKTGHLYVVDKETASVLDRKRK